MSASDQDQTMPGKQELPPSIDVPAQGERGAEHLNETIDKSLELVENRQVFVERIKAPFLQAGMLQMQGEYIRSLEVYQQLINLATELVTNNELTEQGSYYLASAFLNLVKIRSSLPEQSTTELLNMIDFGVKWLEQIQKPGWSASLRLQKGPA